ncbi:MAG: hypothetical protein WEA09_07820 [Gemmatimonadota bacterium]
MKGLTTVATHRSLGCDGTYRLAQGFGPLWTLVLLLGACQASTDASAGGDATDAAAVGARLDAELSESFRPYPAEGRLFAVEGLMGPEAVKYDPDQDVYFISSFGENEPGDANDGFISRAAAEDGSMESYRWAVGQENWPLLDPRGMALAGDSLWVADANGLHAFHRITGAQLHFVDLTHLDPGFLNDVVVGQDGAVYVTDTFSSRVIRLHVGGDGGEVVAEGEILGSPNGITPEPGTGRFILVPWSGGDSLRAWEPTTGNVEMVARTPGGRFDGVEYLHGVMVVASQQDSALHVVRSDADAGVPYQKVPGSPADIAVDTRRNRVAVPYIRLNRVDVFPGVGVEREILRP